MRITYTDSSSSVHVWSVPFSMKKYGIEIVLDNDTSNSG